MSDAWLTLLRLSVLAIAGIGLWRLWRAVRTSDPLVRAIVDAGFLLRATGGLALFWISYLELPILPSLQAGGGVWFFAPDGPGYLDRADEVRQRGVMGILTLGAEYPSHAFVQILAVAVALFGKVLSVFLLVNSVAYLVTCWVVIRLAGAARLRSTPCLFALAALSFGPGALLWSMQLLKDPTLVALAALGVLALDTFGKWWSEGNERVGRLEGAAAAALFATALYTIGGIRWYFAIMLWAASLVFLVMVVVSAPRRLAAAIASTALFLACAVGVRVGIGAELPRNLVAMIAWGHSTSVGIAQRVVPRGWSSAPVEREIAAVSRSHDELAAKSSAELAEESGAEPGDPTPVLTIEDEAPEALAEIEAPPSMIAPLFERARQAFTARGGATLMEVGPALEPLGASSRVARAVSGLGALLLPRFIAEPVGLVRVGGGRGLWAFADLDTIALDAVLLFSLIYSVWHARSWRVVLASPLFVLLALLSGMLLSLGYSVVNFGTLLRLRWMFWVTVAMIPLGLRIGPSGRGSDRGRRE